MLSQDFPIEKETTDDYEEFESKGSDSLSFTSLADDQVSQTTGKDLIMVNLQLPLPFPSLSSL